MRGCKIIRKYLLHSPYKQVVKTMRYKLPSYTARNILKSPSISDATVGEIKHIVNHECQQLCKTTPTPSCLRVTAVKDLSVFKWEHLVEELQNTAPVLTSLLYAAAGESTQAKPSEIAVCVAASLLLRHRCQHICKLHLMVSSLLYAGHTAKRVSVYMWTMEVCGRMIGMSDQQFYHDNITIHVCVTTQYGIININFL